MIIANIGINVPIRAATVLTQLDKRMPKQFSKEAQQKTIIIVANI